MRYFALFGGLLSLIAVIATVIVLSIRLDQDCTGHLKRAADANTIGLAEQELGLAIDYLEREGLTEGYTSVLYKTPDEDIGFFYNNLKESHAELQAVTDSTTQLERSNILIKLRETLIDHGDGGDRITCPTGLSRYPRNGAFGIWLALSLVFFLGGIIAVVVEEL